MTDQVSFKTRVKDTAISIAPDYYFYYIVRAEKDNYLHFVGVSTKLSATV